MNLTSPAQVRALLEEIGVHPNKSLGQNFLIDQNILDIIVSASDLSSSDVVLEIGAGLGVLTDALLANAGQVISVEKDRALYRDLARRYKDEEGLQLHEADALDLGVRELLGSGVTRMISNLPYSAGSRILMEIFEAPHPPPIMVVTLQLDVAERLVAEAGSKAYGLLSIWGGLKYEIQIRKRVKPTCYYPTPQVDSAILVFHRRREPLVALSDQAHFKRLLKLAFSHRRKQVGTILQSATSDIVEYPGKVNTLLAELGIDHRDRPEVIRVEQWGVLSNLLRNDS